MKNGEKLILFLCFVGLLPVHTLQQRISSSNGVYNSPNEKPYKYVSQGLHGKSLAIIILAVLVLAAICYGTNCLFICKMTLCSGAERKYTKMDLTSQV